MFILRSFYLVISLTVRPVAQRSRIFTIGHSIHPIGEFVDLLQAHGVQQLIDVRTIPKSRRNPQFNGQELAKSVEREHIVYRHLPSLGGLRHARKDSINTGWKNASFRGYADYMQSAPFEEGLSTLMEAAQSKTTVIMCAEALPWQCHRSLIADALLARGVQVEHIMSLPTASKSGRKLHEFTPFAKVEGSRVTYPALPLISADE